MSAQLYLLPHDARPLQRQLGRELRAAHYRPAIADDRAA